jgi:hypothetical protein
MEAATTCISTAKRAWLLTYLENKNKNKRRGKAFHLSQMKMKMRRTLRMMNLLTMNKKLLRVTVSMI